MERNEPCWCGSGKKWKKCHFPHQPNKNFSALANDYLKKYGIILKTEAEIERITKSCKLAASILDRLCQEAKAGVTTNDLDRLTAKLCEEAGALAAPLGYGDPPYHKSICTSLNEVICHGIPNDIPLKEGDIMNIDVSTILDGCFGDCSRMVAIGNVSPDKKKVMDVSYQCMHLAIGICAPGVPIWKIGEAIETHAHKNGCSVVNQFVGHGVGIQFHEPPQICHHYNQMQIPMAPGMTFTIEPMINAGVREAVIDSKNGWEARTRDGKPSAQWEHTLLITDSGHQILTIIE